MCNSLSCDTWGERERATRALSQGSERSNFSSWKGEIRGESGVVVASVAVLVEVVVMVVADGVVVDVNADNDDVAGGGLSGWATLLSKTEKP